MQLAKNNFLEFVDSLKKQKFLTEEDISKALEFLDGVNGVLSERTFILGYEGLARYLNKTLSTIDIKKLCHSNIELLEEDSDARYYFSQALIDNKNLTIDDKRELISYMPEIYQIYLFKRFNID